VLQRYLSPPLDKALAEEIPLKKLHARPNVRHILLVLLPVIQMVLMVAVARVMDLIKETLVIARWKPFGDVRMAAALLLTPLHSKTKLKIA
jgi:hypothetical protein